MTVLACLPNSLVWAGGGIVFGTGWLWQIAKYERLEESVTDPQDRLAVRLTAGRQLSTYGERADWLLLAFVPIVYSGIFEGNLRTVLAFVVFATVSLGAFVDSFAYSSAGLRWGMAPRLGEMRATLELIKDLDQERENKVLSKQISDELTARFRDGGSRKDILDAIDEAVDRADRG